MWMLSRQVVIIKPGISWFKLVLPILARMPNLHEDYLILQTPHELNQSPNYCHADIINIILNLSY